MGIVSPLHKTDGLRLLVPSPILKPDALQSATPCSKPGQCGLDQYIVETGSTRQRAVLGIGQYMEEGSTRHRAVLGIGQYMEEVRRAVGRAHDFTTGRPITIMPLHHPPCLHSSHQWSPHISTLHSEKKKPIWTNG